MPISCRAPERESHHTRATARRDRRGQVDERRAHAGIFVIAVNMGDQRLHRRHHGIGYDKVDERDDQRVVRRFVDDLAEQPWRDVGQTADRALCAVAHGAGKLALIANEDRQFAMSGEKCFGRRLVSGRVLHTGDHARKGALQPVDKGDRQWHGRLSGDVVEDYAARVGADAVDDVGEPGEQSVVVRTLEIVRRRQQQAAGAEIERQPRLLDRIDDSRGRDAGVELPAFDRRRRSPRPSSRRALACRSRSLRR